MRSLFQLAFRSWTYRRNRNRLSLISIALAVALMGTLVILTASMQSTVEAIIRRNFGIHDLIVEYRSDPGRTFTAEDVDSVKNIPGVRAAAPAFMTYNRVIPSVMGAYPIYAGVAANPISEAANPVIEGKLPGPGQVALPKPFAERMNVGIGQMISLPFPPGPNQTLTISGLTAGIPGSTRGGIALFEMGWLQTATGQPGKYQAIFVQTERPDDTRLAAQISGELAKLFQGADVDKLDDLRNMRRNMGGLRVLASVLGVFALLASTFLIAGNFVVSLQDRIRELGTVRALGASRGAVFRLVLSEALVMGSIGSVLGVVLALACGYGVIQIAGRAIHVEPAAAVVPWSHLLLAGGGGLGITLVAAVLPAFRTSRLSPVSALGGQFGESNASVGFGSVAGLITAAAGLGTLLYAGVNSTSDSGNETFTLVSLVGGLLMLVGAIGGLPRLLPTLIRGIAGFARKTRRHETLLAARNAVRYMNQARFMFASLSVGVVLCLIGVSVLREVESAQDRTMQQQFPTPFVLQAAGDGGLSPDLTVRTGQLQGVERVVPVGKLVEGRLVDYDYSRADPQWYRRTLGTIARLQEMGVVDAGSPGSLDLAPVDLETLAQIYPFAVTEGRLDVEQFRSGGAVVLQEWAKNLGVKPGDTLSVETGKGSAAKSVSLKVIAVVKAIPLLRQAMLIDRNMARVALGIQQDQTIFVQPVKGSNETVRGALKALLPEFSGVELHDLEVTQANLRSEYGQRLSLVVAAAVIILIVAAASLVTLVVTVLTERRREFGFMRAAGASAAQVRRLIGLEISLVSAASALIALLNGSVLTWALLRTLDAYSPMPSPWAVLGSVVGIAVIVRVVIRVGIGHLDRSSVIVALTSE